MALEDGLTCFQMLGWPFPVHIFDQHTACLLKKAGSATIVDLNMLADIIAELPDAGINISASKPDAA